MLTTTTPPIPFPDLPSRAADAILFLWGLGAWAVAKFLKERNGATCVEAYGHVGDAKGGVSGGTIASALHLMSSTPASIMREMASPHFLTSEGTTDRLDPDARRRWATQTAPRFDEDVGAWTAPSVMAGINTKVVARSAELEPDTFDARLFAYNESDACSSRRGAFLRPPRLAFFFAPSVHSCGPTNLSSLGEKTSYMTHRGSPPAQKT